MNSRSVAERLRHERLLFAECAAAGDLAVKRSAIAFMIDTQTPTSASGLQPKMKTTAWMVHSGAKLKYQIPC